MTSCESVGSCEVNGFYSYQAVLFFFPKSRLFFCSFSFSFQCLTHMHQYFVWGKRGIV